MLFQEFVARKLSSVFCAILSNFGIGTENESVFSGMWGRAETSNKL
jgi:hypothetical protein